MKEQALLLVPSAMMYLFFSSAEEMTSDMTKSPYFSVRRLLSLMISGVMSSVSSMTACLMCKQGQTCSRLAAKNENMIGSVASPASPSGLIVIIF